LDLSYTFCRMRKSLAQSVRAGEIAPIDLVEEAIRRIEDASDLNAVTVVHADAAREAALSHSQQGPLAGLPLLVKDMVRVQGHVTTMGSKLFANAEPETQTDIIVTRLINAGAILVGRTNTPEFGATAFTHNKVFGTTRNPWNKEFSPGGSSGGSSAALAAGLTPLATTSDGGGSVRGPAAAVGLIGYKPTMGLIGRNFPARWIGFSMQGCTAATVDDVVLEASIVMGDAPGDYMSAPTSAVSLTPRMPARVLVCRSFRDDVDPDIEEAFERTINNLSTSDVSIERVAAPSDKSTGYLWLTISAAELLQSLRPYENRWDELNDYVQMQLRFAQRVTIDDYIGAQRSRHELTARFDALLDEHTVLVVPTTNARAWKAEGPLPTAAGNIVDDPSIALNTPELNVTGHPGVSVPIGHDINGVPIGMQIIAGRFRDDLALGLAQHVERIQPWVHVAPGYSPFGLS
jgi:Asp-tRNA(Asn)/Glu-tRNA(Gln) amidotransferase A subunit family amidase